MLFFIHRWACGVIMYTMVAGKPPFWHRKQLHMIRLIMDGSYRFGSPEWDEVSDTTKDLVRLYLSSTTYIHLVGRVPIYVFFCHTQISNLLVTDPQSRFTANDALAHPFFAHDIAYNVPSAAATFNPRRKWKVQLSMLSFSVID